MNVHFSSATPEWLTPPDIRDRVVAALGGIDLDPCAETRDAPNVPALWHFTRCQDGLSRRWCGLSGPLRVYMNPPYGRGPQGIIAWVRKLREEYLAGHVSAAIALVPARTDTAWFRLLRDFPVCFVAGRLKFSGHQDAAPFPSALVYLGSDLPAFAAAFADIGDIYRRMVE